jgi:hypothetical protein
MTRPQPAYVCISHCLVVRRPTIDSCISRRPRATRLARVTVHACDSNQRDSADAEMAGPGNSDQRRNDTGCGHSRLVADSDVENVAEAETEQPYAQNDTEFAVVDDWVASTEIYLDKWSGSDLNRWRAAEKMKNIVAAVSKRSRELAHDESVHEVRDSLRDLSKHLSDLELGDFPMIDEETGEPTANAWVAVGLSVIANVALLCIVAKALSFLVKALIPGGDASAFDL